MSALQDGRPIPSAYRAPSADQRRAADDLEHVGGRGLLLQGLAQIIGTVPNFVEQADVLDGDHRLIGKVAASSICLGVNA